MCVSFFPDWKSKIPDIKLSSVLNANPCTLKDNEKVAKINVIAHIFGSHMILTKCCVMFLWDFILVIIALLVLLCKIVLLALVLLLCHFLL